jgi:hypothetical protein
MTNETIVKLEASRGYAAGNLFCNGVTHRFTDTGIAEVCPVDDPAATDFYMEGRIDGSWFGFGRSYKWRNAARKMAERVATHYGVALTVKVANG